MSVEVLELQSVTIIAGSSAQCRNQDFHLHSNAQIKPSKLRNDYHGNGFLIKEGFAHS